MLSTELSKLLELAGIDEARKPTATQLKRCVSAIASKDASGDPREVVSRAFAICTAQLQKHGYLKDGTQRPTKKGKSAGKRKAAQKDHMDKVGEYEDLLRKARET